MKSPSKDIHDTQDMYKVLNVSYGEGFTITLPDSTRITFAINELTTVTSLDERNLKYCIYLNLLHASIRKLDTTH